MSVSWGGVTVVERTLALMQKATEVDSSWRFFVNLGHVSGEGYGYRSRGSSNNNNRTSASWATVNWNGVTGRKPPGYCSTVLVVVCFSFPVRFSSLFNLMD